MTRRLHHIDDTNDLDDDQPVRRPRRKRRRSRAPWIGLLIMGTVAILCAVLVAALLLARRGPLALPRDYLQPNQERLIGRWQTTVHFGRPGTALLEFQRDGVINLTLTGEDRTYTGFAGRWRALSADSDTIVLQSNVSTFINPRNSNIKVTFMAGDRLTTTADNGDTYTFSRVR